MSATASRCTVRSTCGLRRGSTGRCAPLGRSVHWSSPNARRDMNVTRTRMIRRTASVHRWRECSEHTARCSSSNRPRRRRRIRPRRSRRSLARTIRRARARRARDDQAGRGARSPRVCWRRRGSRRNGRSSLRRPRFIAAPGSFARKRTVMEPGSAKSMTISLRRPFGVSLLWIGSIRIGGSWKPSVTS
jgi:hypothetical protein